MMRTLTIYLIMMISLCLTSAYSLLGDYEVDMKNVDLDTFLSKVEQTEPRKENFIYILHTVNNTEPDWLTPDDVEKLISLVDSEQDAKCVMQKIMSYRGSPKDRTTMGNIALSILDDFKNKRPFPALRIKLLICGDYYLENKQEILIWYNEEYKKAHNKK